VRNITRAYGLEREPISAAHSFEGPALLFRVGVASLRRTQRRAQLGAPANERVDAWVRVRPDLTIDIMRTNRPDDKYNDDRFFRRYET
jgi:hypothetical protein